MPKISSNPISSGQINADLFVAEAAMQKAETISSKASKHLRGLAAYHMQQAAEKIIKYQIYEATVAVNYSRMYRHSLDDLLVYAASLGIKINIPKWIESKRFIITSWEADGRYNLHFVVRMDTLKRCYTELTAWRDSIFR